MLLQSFTLSVRKLHAIYKQAWRVNIISSFRAQCLDEAKDICNNHATHGMKISNFTRKISLHLRIYFEDALLTELAQNTTHKLEIFMNILCKMIVK